MTNKKEPLTKEEIENVEKFVSFAKERIYKLILINNTQDFSDAPSEIVAAREIFLGGLEYTSGKIEELFNDYKTGTEGKIFSMPIQNFKGFKK